MKTFRLKGIKGFVDTDHIEIRPITVIIGQNSSGKSSLMRFPLVLKQTILDDSTAPLLFYGRAIDYGNSYEDVVFKHNKKNPMTFEFQVDPSDLIRYLPAQTPYNDMERTLNKLLGYELLNFSISVSAQNSGSIIFDKLTIVEVANNNELLVITRKNNDEIGLPEHEANVEDRVAVTMGINTERNYLFINIGEEYISDLFDKFILDPDFLIYVCDQNNVSTEEMEVAKFYQNTLISLNRYLNEVANGINYIGPFRKAPERSYRYKGNQVKHVGEDGEFAPVILGNDKRSGGELVNLVSHWLQDHLNFSIDIEDLHAQSGNDAELFKLTIIDHKTNVRNNLMDVGHGLSQLIPIIVETFSDHQSSRSFRGITNSFNLNIIEQPELHLHPAAQACLADLFVAGINHNSNSENKKSFLIETHSEHMLIRLRRYIVEGIIRPNDIAIYYTEKQGTDGSITVKHLQIAPDGRIFNWPEGFFEEDYKEALALRKAVRNMTSK